MASHDSKLKVAHEWPNMGKVSGKSLFCSSASRLDNSRSSGPISTVLACWAVSLPIRKARQTTKMQPLQGPPVGSLPNVSLPTSTQRLDRPICSASGGLTMAAAHQRSAGLIGFIYSLRHKTSAADVTLSLVSTQREHVNFFPGRCIRRHPSLAGGRRQPCFVPIGWVSPPIVFYRLWLTRSEDRGRLHSLLHLRRWPMFTRSESCCLFGVCSLVPVLFLGRWHSGVSLQPSDVASSSFPISLSLSLCFSLSLSFHSSRRSRSLAQAHAVGLDTKWQGQVFSLLTELGLKWERPLWESTENATVCV